MNDIVASGVPRSPISKAVFRVAGGELEFRGRRLFGGSMEQLLDLIFSGPACDAAQVLVTLNVDQTLNAETDSRFSQVIEQASIVTIDGAPISMLARAKRANHFERNTGADLLPAVVAEAQRRQAKVVITGGADDVVQAAAQNLRESTGADVRSVEFPFIKDVGDSRSQSVVSALQEIRPAMVFLCLGSPKQELWFDEWKSELPPALYIGAGAAVDFSAGRAKRAPGIVQKFGLEWLFRLFQEPKRLAHRYLIKGPRFIGVISRSLSSK